MMIYLIATSIVAILVLSSIIRSSIRPTNFPPGPLCLPIVGYLPFLDVRNVGRSFRKLSKSHGNIFSIMVGTKPLVILNSFPVIKEAMSMEELSGRPNMFSGTFFQKGKTGVCTTEGPTWKAQRHFFKSYVDDVSEEKKAFREVMMDEIDDLKIELSKQVGQSVDVTYRINIAIINILWSLASGRRIHEHQQEFQSVYECIDKITAFMSRAVIMSFVPLLSKVLPERITKMERGRYYRNRFVAISEKWIKEHKSSYRGNRGGDLQDTYIHKIKEGTPSFDEIGLGAMLRELFVLGAQSESVMLRWSLRMLSVYRECQEKMQEELDRVGGERDISWDDRDSLDYTMATIAEIQRFADIAPSGIPHKALRDVSLQGFTLPEGTGVLANLNSCHRDPKYWKNPDRFDPNNFLDENNKFIVDKEGFVPFGIGLRRCPAEKLAKITIFLVISNIFKTFSFKLPNNEDDKLGTYYEAGTSFLRNPKPFRVVIQNRR